MTAYLPSTMLAPATFFTAPAASPMLRLENSAAPIELASAAISRSANCRPAVESLLLVFADDLDACHLEHIAIERLGFERLLVASG